MRSYEPKEFPKPRETTDALLRDETAKSLLGKGFPISADFWQIVNLGRAAKIPKENRG